MDENNVLEQRKASLIDKYHQATMLQYFALGKRRGFVGRAGRPVDNPDSGQGRVLACLKLKDGIPTKDLAQILGMRVSSLNELLSKMEKADYVERRQSEQDGRVMLVFVTERGRAIQQHRVFGEHALDVDLFEGFTVEELETLEAFMDRMIENLKASIGPNDLEHLRQKREERREYLHAHFGNSSEAFARMTDDFSGLYRGVFGFDGRAAVMAHVREEAAKIAHADNANNESQAPAAPNAQLNDKKEGQQ